MILDMIQGCRYLRRSTDRWLLSKNSRTRLKGLIGWRKAGLLWNCSIPITDIKGLYLYPCPNMTPGRLRVQHLMSKLMLRRQCPSRICHQLVPSLYRATSPRIPENFPLKEQIVPLPNDGALPTASSFYRIPWEDLAKWYFITKLGPQVSSFPVPFFGVNICPFNYGIKVILFQNWP
jgi:hypothetical protein